MHEEILLGYMHVLQGGDWDPQHLIILGAHQATPCKASFRTQQQQWFEPSHRNGTRDAALFRHANSSHKTESDKQAQDENTSQSLQNRSN